QRFAREARAAAAVRDEHVIDIHAVCESTVPYLVMEFIDGGTLQALLQRTGPLEVKPANILLENGVQRVKLTDFGLARATDAASLPQPGFIAGTPLSMSPEQVNGAAVDHRSALFSLGSVLYEMCTGRPVFRAPNTAAVLRRVSDDTPRPIREINPDIPEQLCGLIACLHAKKPEDRPAKASEVADLLSQLLADLNRGAPLLPERTSAEQRAPRRVAPPERRPVPSRPWLWAAAAVALLLTGLGLGEATGVTDV